MVVLENIDVQDEGRGQDAPANDLGPLSLGSADQIPTGEKPRGTGYRPSVPLGLTVMAVALTGLALIATTPPLQISSQAKAASPTPAVVKPILNTAATVQGLNYELGQTRAVYRTLRVPAKVENTAPAKLAYVEIFCSFYDREGSLLGHGLANWKGLAPGQKVSGEVAASGIDLAAVERRDCKARGR